MLGSLETFAASLMPWDAYPIVSSVYSGPVRIMIGVAQIVSALTEAVFSILRVCVYEETCIDGITKGYREIFHMGTSNVIRGVVVLLPILGNVAIYSYDECQSNSREGMNVGLANIDTPQAKESFDELGSKGASPARMEVLRLLMQKELILTFVSHPKTFDFFVNEMDRLAQDLISMFNELELMQLQFPQDPFVSGRLEELKKRLSVWNFGCNSAEAALWTKLGLVWGIAPKGFELDDQQKNKRGQEFQIRLFKNYLFRSGIGLEDDRVFQELEGFFQSSQVPLLERIIAPLLRIIREGGGRVDDFFAVLFLKPANREDLSPSQFVELERIYNPLTTLTEEFAPRVCKVDCDRDFNPSSDSIRVPASMFSGAPAGSPIVNLELDEGGRRFLAEMQDERRRFKESPSYQAIASLDEKYLKDLFAFPKILNLFLEVLTDVYPERKADYTRLQEQI